MPESKQINVELSTALKRAKTSRMFFAAVMKSGSDGALIVSKSKVAPGELSAAKKKCGGGQTFVGMMQADESGKLVCTLSEQAPANLTKMMKVVAQRDAGLLMTFICRTEPDVPAPAPVPQDAVPQPGSPASAVVAPQADGAPPLAQAPAAQAPAAQAQAAPNGVQPAEAASAAPPRADLRRDVEAKLNRLLPEIEQALGIVKEKPADDIKQLRAAVSDNLAAGKMWAAFKAVNALEQRLREAISAAAAELPVEPSDKYEGRRSEVCVSYDMAVGIQPELQKSMAAIDRLAVAKQYDEAIAELNKVEKDCQAALQLGARQWAVKEHKFTPSLEMARRLNQVERAGLDAANEEMAPRLVAARQANDAPRIAALEAAARRLREAAAPGRDIVALYENATSEASQLNYVKAGQLLDQATGLAKTAKQKLDAEVARVKASTAEAAAGDKKAFDFTSQISDAEWGFDSDADAQNFYIGAATGQLGEKAKSGQLKDMERQTGLALKRRDALLAAGSTPEQAGEVAFANIPRNFWPDNVVREVLMYKRARVNFEEEQRAKFQAAELQAALDEQKSQSEKLGDRIKQTGRTALGGAKELGFLESVPDAEQINSDATTQQLLQTGTQIVAARLPAKISADPATLAGITESLSNVAKFIGVAGRGVGAVASSAEAIARGVQASEVDDEMKPVQKKLLEFQRNRAILDVTNRLIDLGLNWDTVLPAMSAVSAGKDMLQEVIKAVQYFENLSRIQQMEGHAKLDPESMASLPLARMATKEKIRASKATVAAFAKLVQMAGAAAETTGVGAIPGAITKVAGKGLQLLNIAAFYAVNKADASNCVAAMKAAAGPPPNRKAQTLIFKNSSKYARFALAYAAVVHKDPWALGYLQGEGLTEQEIAAPGTSVEIVREFMLTTAGGALAEAEVDEDDPTAGPIQKTSTETGTLDKAYNKLIGRDTSQKYDPRWRATKVELTAANWQEVKKGAIAAGWFDTRSGFGAAMVAYESARKYYNQQLNAAAADTLFASLVHLLEASKKIGTVANEQSQVHEGMVDYLGRLWVEGSKTQKEIIAKRAALIDLAEYGPKSPAEIAKLRKEQLEKAVREQREAIENQAAARKKKIDDRWRGNEHATPFGKMRLELFSSKAFETLKLDVEGIDALNRSVSTIHVQCIDELNRLLSGTPDDKFDEEYARQAAALDGRLVETLRTLSNEQYQAMKKRAAQQNKPIAFDDDEKWRAKDFNLGAVPWKEVKKQAIAAGLQDSSTGIGKALELYDKAMANYVNQQASPMAVQMVLAALRGVNDVFTKFTPIHKVKKLPHVGMLAYRTAILAKVKTELAGYERLLQAKNVAAAAAPPKQEWRASDFSLTKAGWEKMRDEAIADGMVDRRTGLPAAFADFANARTIVVNAAAADARIKEKAKANFVKAADELQKKLEAFAPQTKQGFSHSGMAAYRLKMLEELRIARAAVA
ncbi:MAG TPA: hypothetical protein VHX65_07705 [Pirellulales bacterium]|nr:hypothetical protein [Pirellulales bacterium]